MNYTLKLTFDNKRNSQCIFKLLSQSSAPPAYPSPKLNSTFSSLEFPIYFINNIYVIRASTSTSPDHGIFPPRPPPNSYFLFSHHPRQSGFSYSIIRKTHFPLDPFSFRLIPAFLLTLFHIVNICNSSFSFKIVLVVSSLLFFTFVKKLTLTQMIQPAIYRSHSCPFSIK